MNWLNEMIEWYYATRLDEDESLLDEVVEDPTYMEEIVIAEWEIE